MNRCVSAHCGPDLVPPVLLSFFCSEHAIFLPIVLANLYNNLEKFALNLNNIREIDFKDEVIRGDEEGACKILYSRTGTGCRRTS